MAQLTIPYVDITVDVVVRHCWHPAHALHHSSPGGAYPLWLMLEGAAEVRYPDGVFPVRKGEAGLFPAQIPRNISTSTGAEWLSYVMRVTLPNGVDWLNQFSLPFIWTPDRAQWAAMQALMEMALAEWQHVQAETTVQGTSYTILSGLGKALLGHSMRAIQHEHAMRTEAPAVDSWLTDLLNVLQTQPSLTVGELAEISHYSLTQFRRLFRAHVGVSPHQYLQRYRMDCARHLLAITDQSISAIAETLGYENLSHFSRTFKTTYGVLPSEYRKDLRVRE